MENKTNNFLLIRYCLQSISKLGHHRAIANRINQSDYFGVFNSMLASELTIAGKIAVDGYSEEVSACVDKSKGQMGSLVADLRRTCTSTSYTYLYATEVGFVDVTMFFFDLWFARFSTLFTFWFLRFSFSLGKGTKRTHHTDTAVHGQ